MSSAPAPARLRRAVRPERPERPGGRGHGQALVEFAIILPVLVLIVLGAVDFGRVLFSWIEVQNASREAAAYAILNPTDSSGIRVHAQQETSVQSQRGEGGLTITVTCQRSDTQAGVPCNSLYVNDLGSTVTVSVTEPFTFFTPLIGNMMSGFHLSASSTGFYMSPVNGTASTPSPTPSATPSATPSPTPDPSATPTPTPTPMPTPSLCTVPDFVGLHANQAVDTWKGAGFDAKNLTSSVTGNSKIKGQSLGAGTSQPCSTAVIELN